MLKYSIVIVLSFSYLLNFEVLRVNDRTCEELKAQVEIIDARDGNDGSIKVSCEAVSDNFRIHLVKVGGKVIVDDKKINEVKDLSPGLYDLIVSCPDVKFCQKYLRVTIK